MGKPNIGKERESRAALRGEGVRGLMGCWVPRYSWFIAGLVHHSQDWGSSPLLCPVIKVPLPPSHLHLQVS